MTIMLALVYLLIAAIALWLLIGPLMRSYKENPSSQQQAIVITGCDSGIGLGLAKYFHQTTSFKIICGFLNAPTSQGYKQLSQLDAGSNNNNNNRLILQQLDITSPTDVANFVARIKKLQQDGHIKQLVALINNAGVLSFGEFDWLTWDLIEVQVKVNLLGTLRMTRAMLPFIIESKGRILNTSTIGDTAFGPFFSVYLATKSGLSRFSQLLGYELARFGVRVINVRPGPAWTNISGNCAIQGESMWLAMDAKRKQLHGDFFRRAQDAYWGRMELVAKCTPAHLDMSYLFVHYRRALLSRNAPTTVTCLPFHLKFVLFVFELIPFWLQWRLFHLLLPSSYKYNKMNSPPDGSC